MNNNLLPTDLPELLKTAHAKSAIAQVNTLLNKYNLVDIEDHTFLNVLNGNSIVLDLGGWRGDFAQKINQQFGCEVHIFEPNRNQIEILNGKFSENPKIKVHPYAIGGRDEIITFFPSPEDFPGNEKGSSILSSSPYVDESLSYEVGKKCLGRINQFIDVEHFDLIKMDIEGAEEEVFEDSTSIEFLSKASMLSIEFHYKMPINGQVLIPERKIIDMIKKLESVGFNYLDFGRNYQYIDCLFYRV